MCVYVRRRKRGKPFSRGSYGVRIRAKRNVEVNTIPRLSPDTRVYRVCSFEVCLGHLCDTGVPREMDLNDPSTLKRDRVHNSGTSKEGESGQRQGGRREGAIHESPVCYSPSSSL